MALKGCQQTGQKLFQDIFLSSLILSGWNLMGPSICNHNDLLCWHISGGILWYFTVKVFFDLHTNGGQLDRTLQIWKEIKAMWHPARDISCFFIERRAVGTNERWQGDEAAALCWRAKKRGQVGACPVLRTCMKPFIFHTPALFKGSFMNSKLRVLFCLIITL